MRVIAGEKKGFPLKAPKGSNTRPTSDKIKGSIYNMINNNMSLNGKKAIDCFAGSGGLGIEFLSRGGEFCLFVEQNSQSYKTIHENIEKTSYGNKSKLVKGNVFSILDNERFDLFLIDPPYNKGIAQRTIDMVTDKDLLNQGGLIVVETDSKESVKFSEDYFVLKAEKSYGDTKITILSRS